MIRYCQACGDEREIPLEMKISHREDGGVPYTYFLCGPCIALVLRRILPEMGVYTFKTLKTYMDGMVRR